MTVECIDGRAGKPHIDGSDKGRLHAGIVGKDSVVLPVGKMFAATLDGLNKITIGTGDCLIHGRHCSVTAPEQLTIASGTQGQRRNDLVCIRYKRTGEGNLATESADLVVLKGIATSSGAPSDPYIPGGNVLNGASEDYYPLYRISLNGITVSDPVKLFKVTQDIQTLGDSVSQVKRDSGFIRLWGYSSYYITYRKVGDLVELYWYFPHSNNAAWSPDAALPPDVRPLDNIYASAIATDGNGTAQALQGLMWIGVNGTVESRIVNTRQGIYNRGHTSWIAAKV